MKRVLWLSVTSLLLSSLTCMATDEPDLRLVGGTSNCNGILEMRHQGEWRPVGGLSFWNLKSSSIVCKQLDCGTTVSTKKSSDYPSKSVWKMTAACVGSESSLRECLKMENSENTSYFRVEIICAESVRLVNGPSSCSGRVEVKSNQSWVSVCEGDFDQQDAEVVCRQLGCGAPPVLKEVLYVEANAPLWTKEFQCEGNESVLLDCRTSDSTRTPCSSDKTVGLTCSEPEQPVRLVGGVGRCAGRLETKYQGEWRRADQSNDWNLKAASVVCRQLDCGSALSTKWGPISSYGSVWYTRADCVGSESSLRECVTSTESASSGYGIEVICSESVRLVNGTSMCSGRVEVKSNQSWVSVCEGDFDQQDAEVVCRELGCRAPSVLQGALYGEGNSPMSAKEFQCDGSESVLRDCVTSDSTRITCSPDKTVGLTCSEPDDIRLVGGTSSCTGNLEMKHRGEWRQVHNCCNKLKAASVVCRQLGCGSTVSSHHVDGSTKVPVWLATNTCFGSESSVRECLQLRSDSSTLTLEVICSGAV